MLLEFKMKNFKSFKEEIEFKMTPTRIKDLEYSLITKNIKENEVKALSSAAIYGPNSSGKTNLIGGMEVFRSIILSGNIMNKENITTPNTAVNNLELIPNVRSNEKEPVSFYIKFVSQDLMIEYRISIELGNFLEPHYDRKIVEEALNINNVLIYERTNQLKIGKIEEIKDYLIENFSNDTAEKIAVGDFLEKLKNRKSDLIVQAVWEYIGNHPEVMAENAKIVITVRSTPTDEQTFAKIQSMIDAALESLKDNMKYQIEQENRSGQEEPTGPNQQDLDDMLDNLTIFDQ